jgi:hypothetical protein
VIDRARGASGQSLPAAHVGMIWGSRLRLPIVAFLVAVWLLVALLVGLATSGGVVWF